MTAQPKICQQCGGVLERRPKEAEVEWIRRKFCSLPCSLAKRRQWVKRGSAEA